MDFLSMDLKMVKQMHTSADEKLHSLSSRKVM